MYLQVMILDLCQYVQNFLHAHNKPQFKSFYEEMMSNKQKQEEKIAKEHQKKMEIKKKKEEKKVCPLCSQKKGDKISSCVCLFSLPEDSTSQHPKLCK